MVADILTMIGGAILGPPVTELYGRARRRTGGGADDVQRALVESYLQALQAILDASRLTPDWERRGEEIVARVQDMCADALTILEFAITPGDRLSPGFGATPGTLPQQDRVNAVLLARLESSERWLKDAPPALVNLVRAQLLPRLLIGFRDRVRNDPVLARQLVLDLAAATGQVAGSTSATAERIDAAVAAAGQRLDELIAQLGTDASTLEAELGRIGSDVDQVRRTVDELLDRWDEAKVSALPLPNRFRALIREKTRGFVGRQYVYREFDDWVDGQPSGYFTVVGEPGAGKSAILAQYVHSSGCPAHFNQRTIGMAKAEQFLGGICRQLIQRFGLPYADLPADATRDGAYLAELLDEVEPRLEGSKLVIVVDALDEADANTQDRAANILYLPPYLPDGVFFLLSRRHVPVQFDVQAYSHTLDLTDERFRDGSREDVKTYLYRSIRRPGIQRWIADQGLAVDEYVTRLADKSDTNFMYLHHVTRDIEAGGYYDRSIDSLPSTLQGYYTSHWRLMGMDTFPLPQIKLRVLYVLLEYGQPASVEILASFVGEPAGLVQEVLHEWGQFLRAERTDGTMYYAIYHESFADFLRGDEVMQASRIDLEEVNGLIADYLYTRRYQTE